MNDSNDKPNDSADAATDERPKSAKLAFLDAFEAAMIEVCRRLREPAAATQQPAEPSHE